MEKPIKWSIYQCPCGALPQIGYHDISGNNIHCGEKCGRLTKYYVTIKEAIDAWNKLIDEDKETEYNENDV